jgi:hypothetical protein
MQSTSSHTISLSPTLILFYLFLQFLRPLLYLLCVLHDPPLSLFTLIIFCEYFLLCNTHSWSWVLLEKLPIVQLLKNFPAFYGTRRFITMFTRALHWSLSWATSIQSIPSHPISLRSISILFTHLRLGFPSGRFPSGFPTNLSHSCYIHCPSHPPWLDHSNYT